MLMAKKILLIDDDRDLVESLGQALKANGYEVVTALSGSAGLKTLLAEKPDLLILDVMMETDTAGFEAAAQIRSDRESSRYREFREIPIILLTAINQVTNNRFSLDDSKNFLPDIDDFLTKPVDIDDLLAKIEAALN
jgi:CheY-like chemotaxis protein